MCFSKNMRYHRINKGISLQQLAEELNVSTNYLSLLERGMGKVKPVFIPELLKALNVSYDDLFEKHIHKYIE